MHWSARVGTQVRRHTAVLRDRARKYACGRDRHVGNEYWPINNEGSPEIFSNNPLPRDFVKWTEFVNPLKGFSRARALRRWPLDSCESPSSPPRAIVEVPEEVKADINNIRLLNDLRSVSLARLFFDLFVVPFYSPRDGRTDRYRNEREKLCRQLFCSCRVSQIFASAL